MLRLALAAILIAGAVGCAGRPPEGAEPPTHPFQFVVNDNAPPPARGPAGVAVGTYNVRWLRDESALRDDFAALNNVDVWCLQEVRLPDGDDLPRAAAEALARLLPAGRWYCAAAAVNRLSELRSGDWEAQVIASRLPLDAADVWQLDPGSAVRKRRVALAATIVSHGKRVRVVNTDHAPSLKSRPGDNDRQVAALLRYLDAEPTTRVVVAGDFNCAGSFFPPRGNAAHVRSLDARFGAVSFRSANSRAATFRWGPLSLRLDRVYTRRLDASRGNVGSGATGSDHYPVWCEVGSGPD